MVVIDIDIRNINAIAATIETRRKSLAISQADLAEKSGVSQVMISYIESGKRIPGLMNFVNIISQLQLVLKIESEK